MDRSTINEYLSRNSILKCADGENINKYFTDNSISVKDFGTGEIIYSPQHKKRAVGMLLDGKAMAEPVGAKDSALLRFMSKNDLFGVANLYSDGEPFPSIIVAKTSVKVLFIDGQAFCSLIDNDSGARQAYLRFMSNRIIFLNKKISTLTAGSTEKKLAFHISENELDGVYSPTVSMSALAEMLSVGRASLYRALDTLENDGLIKRDGKNIYIPDKIALLNSI